MKMINRVLTAMLTAAMALSLGVPARAASEDVRQKYRYNFNNDPLGIFLHEDREYASAAIAALAEGYGEETEDYLYALAKEGIIVIFIRSANWIDILVGPNYPNGDGSVPIPEKDAYVREYTDVAPEAWYYGAVMEASRGGLMYGGDDGAFRPDDRMTVAEFAAILCRVYNLPVEMFGVVWYKPYIDAMTVAGLEFSSCTNERALDEITRGEAIEAMTVMLRARGGEPERALTWGDVEDAGKCAVFPKGHGWNAQALLDALNYGVIDGMNTSHRVDAASPLTRAELCKMMQNIGVTRARSVDSYKANEVYRQYKEREIVEKEALLLF